jgi:hypothetical protein
MEKNSSSLFGPLIQKDGLIQCAVKGLKAIWFEVFLTTIMWGFVLWLG